MVLKIVHRMPVRIEGKYHKYSVTKISNKVDKGMCMYGHFSVESAHDEREFSLFRHFG